MAAPVVALDGAWGGRRRPQHFGMASGDDRTITVTLYDRSGTLVSLTGTFVWILAASDDPADSAQVTKSGSVTAGVFSVALDDTDTDDLAGRYYHEATVTETSGGAESVVMSGIVTIGRDQG